MASSRVKVGVVQMQCSDDPAENMKNAVRKCGEAAALGAEIVCLPELFRSRYFCQTEDPEQFKLAESVPGPSTVVLEELAKELDVVIIASLFEVRTAGLYNNTVAVLDGRKGYAGKYRKMHIPDDPRYYEKYYFAPGDLGFKTFDTSKGKVGTLICWDQWYPEAARLTALQGAEILFYPTAIGWHPSEREQYGTQQHGAWEVSQRAHAVANGCYVVSVNRTGFEPSPDGTGPEDGIKFWGQSFVVAPDGSIIQKASTDEEEVFVVELDLEMIGEIRHGWPFFRDRRIDAYGQLTRRFIDAD
jgi:N-carbamoylputrescine amidase